MSERLRIIAGKLRGRRLAPFHDAGIRPTKDFVREAVTAETEGRIAALERELNDFFELTRLETSALRRGTLVP